MLRTYAQQVCRASSGWAEKRCEPCEAAADALKSMGLEMRMDMATAQQHASKLDPRWQIVQDDQQRLRLRKTLRTKNFTKALELFQRVGQLAEAEGHHPDLHLEGWNNVTLELWTHARDGLSDNDFIVAAKIDALGPDLADLLSKKQPPMPGSES